MDRGLGYSSLNLIPDLRQLSRMFLSSSIGSLGCIHFGCGGPVRIMDTEPYGYRRDYAANLSVVPPRNFRKKASFAGASVKYLSSSARPGSGEPPGNPGSCGSSSRRVIVSGDGLFSVCRFPPSCRRRWM